MTTVQQAISSVGPVLLLAANCTTSPGSTSSPPEPDASLDASATEIINLQPTADCRHPDVERNCNDGFCRIPEIWSRVVFEGLRERILRGELGCG